MKTKFWIACACFIQSVAVLAAQEQVSPESLPPIHFGIASFTAPNTKFELFQKTFEAIQTAVAPRAVIRTIYPNKSFLEKALENEEVDIVMSGAGVYRRRLDQGLRDVATMFSAQEPNPDKAVGSVFITRQDFKEPQSIQELKGLTLAARHPLGFQGICIALGEVAKYTSDPEKFFSQISYVGGGEENVVNAVILGKADVGIVRTCFFEDRRAIGKPVEGVVPILIKDQSDIVCKTSTDLYPNWSLSVTRRLAPDEIWKIIRAIHIMPATTNGMGWTVASDFGTVDQLNKTLRIGPYEFLRTWSLQRIWAEYRSGLIFLLLLAIFLVAHTLRSSALVNRRTKELNAAHEKERELERSAQEASEKLERLQKLNTVTQLSSLVAHELSQPLAAIACHAKVLERLQKKSQQSQPLAEDAVESISRNIGHATEILQKVKSVARKEQRDYKKDDLNEISRRALERFKTIFVKNSSTTIEQNLCKQTLPVIVDRLEIDLAVINLLKNAYEASMQVNAPRIEMSTFLSKDGKTADISITDNSCSLSEEDFSKIAVPLMTTKVDGLGLGLSIVRAIAERHQGALKLSRSSLGSLIATISLPIADGERADV
ncbi:MAG: PhnD/SsuA/transferrin family substrate-binding protein [Sutterellaceae bacterium]|nr:PhnD/SsuA/transferrin family substrate-binding protein [Sutterellaceae bacterium]